MLNVNQRLTFQKNRRFLTYAITNYLNSRLKWYYGEIDQQHLKAITNIGTRSTLGTRHQIYRRRNQCFAIVGSFRRLPVKPRSSQSRMSPNNPSVTSPVRHNRPSRDGVRGKVEQYINLPYHELFKHHFLQRNTNPLVIGCQDPKRAKNDLETGNQGLQLHQGPL